MNTINLTSIAAANEVASAIALGENFTLAHPGYGVTSEYGAVRVGDYTEFRLVNEDGLRSANVTVERPRASWREDGQFEPSAINWSSAGGSRIGGTAPALLTADVLAFAARVAAILDRWAAEGQLSYLTTAA